MLSDHVTEVEQHIARLQALKADLQAILRSPGMRSRRRKIRRHAVCPVIETVSANRRTLTNGGVTR
jgi:hypothetical protein